MRELIHKIGLEARTVATCTGLQCIRYDNFTLDHALLRKHWRLQFVLDSIAHNNKMLMKTRNQSAALQLADSYEPLHNKESLSLPQGTVDCAGQHSSRQDSECKNSVTSRTH